MDKLDLQMEKIKPIHYCYDLWNDKRNEKLGGLERF